MECTIWLLTCFVLEVLSCPTRTSRAVTRWTGHCVIPDPTIGNRFTIQRFGYDDNNQRLQHVAWLLPGPFVCFPHDWIENGHVLDTMTPLFSNRHLPTNQHQRQELEIKLGIFGRNQRHLSSCCIRNSWIVGTAAGVHRWWRLHRQWTRRVTVIIIGLIGRRRRHDERRKAQKMVSFKPNAACPAPGDYFPPPLRKLLSPYFRIHTISTCSTSSRTGSSPPQIVLTSVLVLRFIRVSLKDMDTDTLLVKEEWWLLSSWFSPLRLRHGFALVSTLMDMDTTSDHGFAVDVVLSHERTKKTSTQILLDRVTRSCGH